MDLENSSIGDLVAAPVRIAAQYAGEAATNLASVKQLEAEKPQLTTFEVCDRTYLLDRRTGTYKEVRRPKVKLRKFPEVATLDGVAQIALQHATPDRTVVTVGKSGTFAYVQVIFDEVDIEGPVRGDAFVNAPYFNDDAPDAVMSIEGLYGWLDRFNGRIGQRTIAEAEEKAIWMALRSLRAVKAETYEVDDNGGSYTVRAKSEAGIIGENPLPKFLRVLHRRGVAEFETEHTYRLRAHVGRSDKSGVMFEVTHMDTDGAHQRFVTWALEQLQEQLNGAVGAKSPWIICAAP